MEQTLIDPQTLAAAQQVLMANWAMDQGLKAVSSTPRSGGYAHGPYGLMSAPGMSRDPINAMILPQLGLLRLLPSRPSTEEFPLYGIITGQTAASGVFNGSNSGGVCGNPPTAGLLKLCKQSYRFGRQAMMTPVLELDRIGRINNRAEFTDYRLVGGPIDSNWGPTIPGDGGIAQALSLEVAKVSYELANDWVRNFAPFLYSGNRTNNTGGGIIVEYNGLDGLINTGYRDADTQTLCPAADSFLRSFNSVNVATNAAASNGIVQSITGIDRQMRDRASRMGLNPVRWVMVMRSELFYQLTEIWPCAYNTYRCTTNDANQPINNDGLRLMAQRDEMRGNWDARTGQFLWIDGIKREVVLDDTIAETALSSGAFNSSIYWVPLTVIGGFEATYMEYFNYDTPQGAIAAAKIMAPGDSFFTTDNGRFLWHKRPPEAYCVQAQVKTEPRLILRTPQIAARLTNVAYTPWQHMSDWDPTKYYFYDGGATGQGTAPSFWSANSNVG